MVRCKDCGLLAVRSEEAGRYAGVGEKYRGTGIRPVKLGDAEAGPTCIVRACDLDAEFGAAEDRERSTPKAVLEVIDSDRECDGFVAWRKAFSPKEHVEMHQLEMLRQQGEERLRADAERAEQRRREDREWQARQRREDQEWQDRRDAVEWQRKKHLAAIVAAIGVVTGLLGFGAKWVVDRISAPQQLPTTQSSR